MLENLVVLLFFDVIIINLGILLSFYIRFLGNIPQYNIAGYEALYIPITLSYILMIFLHGLYFNIEKLSYYKIIIKSFKIVIFATLLSMMFAYFFRAGRAYSFPFSVFLVSIFVNLFFIASFRIIARLYATDINIFNKFLAFIFNRIPEAILIILGVYVSFLIKFRTINLPEYNFASFIPVVIIICFSYFVFIYRFLLYKYSREQSNFSVLYVMLKTSIAAFICAAALLYIFREKYLGFPSSVLVISFIINYFSLAIWHILIRRGFLSEIEVDLNAKDEELLSENAENESEPKCCAYTNETDGFFVYFNSILKPSKSIKSFSESGSSFFSSAIILYLITFWMILVYICFMPDYLRAIFQKAPLKYSSNQFLYLNNLRIFALYVFTIYLLFVLIKLLIFKILKYQKIKNIISANFYYYSLNLIFFLLVIILGNYTTPYIMILSFILFETWIILLDIFTEKKILEVSIVKTIMINIFSGVITLLCWFLSLFLFYNINI